MTVSTIARVKYFILLFYVWLAIVFFGSVLSETILLYPNIFYDVPGSLGTAMDFMKAMGPHDFFPKIGMLLLSTLIVSLILHWRNKRIRNLILLSFALILIFDLLFSVLYFWPRNTVMFVEGSAVHSPQRLREVAREFQTGHWLRVAAAGVSSLLALATLNGNEKSVTV